MTVNMEKVRYRLKHKLLCWLYSENWKKHLIVCPYCR